MNKFAKNLLMSAFVAACATSSAFAAQEGANNQASESQMTESAPQSQNFDDDTLMKFTEAMQAVGQVANKYDAEFKKVESPEEAKKIQQAAQSEMVAKIEKTGLSVQTYSTIAQQVQVDEKLRDRVLKMANIEENS